MLEVSDEIKNLYASTSQPKHLIITFPEINFTVPDSMIKFESMSLDESICEDDNINFVGCISSKFNVTLYNIPQEFDLKGLEIHVSMRIGDDSTEIPLFNGWVSDVQLETNRAYKDITAYDYIYSKLSDLDVAEWYNQLSFPLTLGELRNSLFAYLVYPLYIYLYQEETTLPNDDLVIERKYVPETLSFIDVIKSICQINGVFGIINRQNKFEYRLLNTEVVGVFGTNYKEATYQEYILSPTERIVIRENSSKTGIGYPVLATDTKYIIQSNIFMSGYETDTVTKRNVAEKVFNSLEGITYRPFSATNYGAPWLECGDTVSYTMYDFAESAAQGEDIWVTASYTILKRHLSGIQNLFDEFSADGNEYTTQFISDIGLSWVVEDELDNIRSSVDENKISFSTDADTNDITVHPDDSDLVAYLPYRSSKGSFIVMHAEFELDMNGNTDLEIYYTNKYNSATPAEVINNEGIIPMRTIVGNTLHLMYFFNSIVTSKSSIFRIYFKNNNATNIIRKSGRAYLMIKGDPAIIKSMEVEQEPDKVEYARGELLDFTGLKVVITYNDGTREDVTDICSYDPPEGSPAELDWNRVDIFLNDNDKTYSTSFTIDVRESDTDLISGININRILRTFVN